MKKSFDPRASGLVTMAELLMRLRQRAKPAATLEMTPDGADWTDAKFAANDQNEKRITHLSERLNQAREGLKRGGRSFSKKRSR